MKEMEEHLEHDITPSGRQNVNKSAVDSIKTIVKGLKEGLPKPNMNFMFILWNHLLQMVK